VVWEGPGRAWPLPDSGGGSRKRTTRHLAEALPQPTPPGRKLEQSRPATRGHAAAAGRPPRPATASTTPTSTATAPRGALSYPRRSREELEGMFLGPMAYPDLKGERNNRMPGKRRSCPGVRGEASRDPRDMAKAVLPEAESPEDEKAHPPERHLSPAPCSAMAFLQGRRNLRGMERCPVRAIKEMSRTPKSRSDVRQGRTRDQPSGCEPQGDGRPIVVVGATTHQGGRERRPQGEGA
jgi:hypothetical protein